MKNNFTGRVSAKMSAFEVAKKWKISPNDFIPILEKGTKHEMEHTTDKDIARRIALDHIEERLDYYDQLEKLDKINFAKGGKNFNDEELLKKYNAGKSIGFTGIAHLKSEGLIERADGTKRKSPDKLEKMHLGGNMSKHKGGEIEKLIDQGEIELKVYPTTPEHANMYGLKSENPLYIQSIFISENQRLKGIGKKVLKYLNYFAIKNGHDVMFGHIIQKASFSKDDSRESNLDDVDMIKNWLQSNGYEICEGNNDFYKVMNNPDIRFDKGGELENAKIISIAKSVVVELGEIYSENDYLGKCKEISEEISSRLNNINIYAIPMRIIEGEDTKYKSLVFNHAYTFLPYKNYIVDTQIWQLEGNIDDLSQRKVLFSFEEYNQIVKLYDVEPIEDWEERFAKGGRTIAQTPAPASDRVYGSKSNPKGSASDTSLAKSIKFNESLLKAIDNKVKAHNEAYPSKKVTTATAKAVVRRGMGAYSKSHRPTITGGAPNSRQAWGLARLNKFLLKKRGVKVKSAYIQDDDLL